MTAERRYFDEGLETMPRPALEAMQEERLIGEMVPWAWQRSPLLQAAWRAAGITPDDIKSMDDYREKVPYITKDDNKDPHGGLLCVDPKRTDIFRAVFSTSGTTGDPTPVPSPPPGPSILTREFWEMGCRPGDYFTHCLFTYRGPGIHHTIRAIGATPIFLDHSPADFPQFFRFSTQYRPTAMYSLSGPLILALEHMAPKMGVDLVDVFSSYKGIVYAGEPLGSRARGRLEEWGVDFFIHTGVGDVGAATECQEHNGCHIWEDIAFVESLDPAGDDPVADGERGELVASTLVDKIAPLLRYRSDDLVRITRQRCDCGRTHSRMWPLGRKGDEIVVEGVSVLPGDIWPAIEAVPETSAALFQVIRTGREQERLRLRVGYSQEAEGRLADVRTRVTDSVHAAVGVAPDVELVPNDVLLRQGPPHKIPRVTKA
jgi:phenylacetate-CoA ligase